MRHALKCEKIVRVGEGQPSGDFEVGVPHLSAVCKGAVFPINENESDRFPGMLQERKSIQNPGPPKIRNGLAPASAKPIYYDALLLWQYNAAIVH